VIRVKRARTCRFGYLGRGSSFPRPIFTAEQCDTPRVRLEDSFCQYTPRTDDQPENDRSRRVRERYVSNTILTPLYRRHTSVACHFVPTKRGCPNNPKSQKRNIKTCWWLVLDYVTRPVLGRARVSLHVSRDCERSGE